MGGNTEEKGRVTRVEAIDERMRWRTGRRVQYHGCFISAAPRRLREKKLKSTPLTRTRECECEALCEENRATFIHASSSSSSFVSSSSFNHLCSGRRGLWGTREKKGQKENRTRRARERGELRWRELRGGDGPEGEKKRGKLAE